MKKAINDKFKKIAVSIEIHDSFLKLSEVVSFKGKRTFRLVKKRFSSKKDSDISHEIANIFKTLNISQKKVSLNIPRHLVMLRFLHIPSIRDEEIKNMVDIESVRQTPYATEETIVGYRVIEKLKNGYSDVLLSIAEAKTIHRFVNILKNAKLSIEKIALGSESLLAWYLTTKGAPKEGSKFTAALLNVDSEYIGIDIIQKRSLTFARSFSYAATDSSTGGDAVDEIKKSITVYQKENKISVDKIFISGAGSVVKKLLPILQEKLGISLETVAQEENIGIYKTIGTDLEETSFLEVIGLSANNKHIEINLLPESLREENDPRLLKKNLLKTGALLVCVILVFFGLTAKKIFYRSGQLLLLDKEIAAIEPQVKEAKRMRQYIKVIKNKILKKPLAIDILTEVYNITPEGVMFNLLDYASNGSFLLRGSAPSLSEAIVFMDILEKSPYFENVKIKHTAKRTTGDKQVTDFEIICDLPGSLQ
ncbi:pilus assembly protein PilM [Candidatus Omnitrophota bacterium]